MNVDEFWAAVENLFTYRGQRWGQAMFNTLEASGINMEELRGSLADPFYRIKTRSSSKQWFVRYVKVEDNIIVGFNREQIVWT